MVIQTIKSVVPRWCNESSALSDVRVRITGPHPGGIRREEQEMDSKEQDEQVLCQWCSFYSAPASSCDQCGSPLRSGLPTFLLIPARV